MIRVSDIRRSFGALRALDGATFEARPGEVLGLLGPNGAGKSTLIAICTGQLVPDAGTVDIMGLGSPLRPEVRRIIGIAPQQIALHDDLTARENLAFLGRIHGVREPVRRADELLARVGLLPRARDRPCPAIACRTAGSEGLSPSWASHHSVWPSAAEGSRGTNESVSPENASTNSASVARGAATRRR